MSRKHILALSIAFIPLISNASEMKSVTFADLASANAQLPALQVYLAESDIQKGNYDSAANHYLNAIRHDLTAVSANLTSLIKDKKLTKDVMEQAVKEISSLAQNDSNLSYFLGDFYENNKVSENYSNAFFWYNNAMRLGSVNALKKVADLVLDNKGGSEKVYSVVDALTMYKKYTDDTKDPVVALKIAEAVFNGELVERDYFVANKYYELAVSKGAYEGSYNLGYIYEKGLGVEVDLEKAIVHYRESLSSETAKDSYYRLARIYLYGEGKLSNPIVGYSYLVKAADLGLVEAQYKLGLLSFYGSEFVKVDIEKAISYFNMASDAGYKLATLKLVDIYTQGASGIKPSSKIVRELEKRL